MAQESQQDGPRRFPPQPAWTVDARAGAACQAEVIQTLERLLGLLQTGSPAPRAGALACANRRFGRHLSSALEACADMLQGCGAPFQFLPFSYSTLRQLDVRIRVLQNAKASLDSAAAAVAEELGACRVQAAASLDDALRTLWATLDNPGAPPQLRRPLLAASGPLRSLLEARGESSDAAGAPADVAPDPTATAAPAVAPEVARALPAAARTSRRRRKGPKGGDGL